MATATALAVAKQLGLDVDRPRLLKDSNNTIVHLAPADLVAKVGTSHFRDVQLESLEREVAVAAHLVAHEAPVVPPAREVDPGPHRHGAFIVTLWQYVRPVRPDELDPGEVSAALKTVHDALGSFPASLPQFSVELEDARRLLESDRSPALASADRAFLVGVLDEVDKAVSRLAVETRPLHGSPHAGNWLQTSHGLVLLDFETACQGPLEWDLAALEDRAVNRFPNVDAESILLLRRVRSACVAAKCWAEPDRAPDVYEAAHVHLKLLRGQPLD